LVGLRKWLDGIAGGDSEVNAQRLFAGAQIRRFEENPKEVIVPKPADPPPGQPIGCDWGPDQ
jgi:hypothetical protein